MRWNPLNYAVPVVSPSGRAVVACRNGFAGAEAVGEVSPTDRARIAINEP
jgi:hypothetical protein